MSKLNSLLLAFFMATPAMAADQCPPAGYTSARLQALKEAGFVLQSDTERNALALGLLACLAHPDPAIRDGIAFEGLSTWLRGGNLGSGTIEAIHADLVRQIQSTSDPQGFQQPFAALMLAEVVRTDRIEPWLTPERRAASAGIAAAYLSGVRDYRGFSATEGWRHGVAHGSDLVLQLVLNPKVEAAHVATMMDALATQIAPEGAVFYVYGEPGRLARAVFFAHQRGVLEEAWWAKWFEGIAAPGFLENWNAAFSTDAGLARRHNTTAFLLALHFNATSAGDENAAALDALVVRAMNRVLGQ